MQPKETTTLDQFYSDMEKEEEKGKIKLNKEKKTESDHIPSKIKEENDDKIPKNLFICQQNKTKNISTKNLVNEETAITSKPKSAKKEVSDIKKRKMQQFLDSSIDMFNNILDDYEIKRKFSYTDVDMLLEKYPYKKMKRAGLWELIVFGCPGNINIINSAIKKEMELGKSIFRILINFKLKKLYKYFKNDGTVITEGGKIFIFNEDAFKTLKYFKK